MPQFSLADTAGRLHTPSEWTGKQAVVLFFLTTDCPLCNTYVPELNRIAGQYSSRGIAFYAVQGDATLSAAAVRQHAKEYGYTFPYLFDQAESLAAYTGAATTPEAAVLSPGGQLLYLGRIDNRLEDYGKPRTQVTEFDLREALDAILAGKPVPHPRTKALGCAIRCARTDLRSDRAQPHSPDSIVHPLEIPDTFGCMLDPLGNSSRQQEGNTMPFDATRRTFAATAMAAAAVPFLSPRHNRPAARHKRRPRRAEEAAGRPHPPRNMKIGHTGITWSRGDGGPADLAIKDVGGLGYAGFETFGDTLDQYETQGGIGRVLEAANLQLISGYTTIDYVDPAKRKDGIAKLVGWGKLIQKIRREGGGAGPEFAAPVQRRRRTVPVCRT